MFKVCGSRARQGQESIPDVLSCRSQGVRQLLWHVEPKEPRGRVTVILTAFIDDSYISVRSGRLIVYDSVQLTNFKGGLVPLVVDTDGKLRFWSC